MSNTTTYYRSTAPEVMRAWEEWREQERAYCAEITALTQEFPGSVPVARLFYGGSRRHLVGLRAGESPGPLWAMKRGDTFWSPLLKTADGKRLRDRLEAVRLEAKALPGMPPHCSSGMGLHWHGREECGDVIWVEWGCAAEFVERSPSFSPTLWERALPSAYHLAKEAHEPEKAQVAG